MSYLSNLSRLSKLTRSNLINLQCIFFVRSYGNNYSTNISPVKGIEIYGRVNPNQKS